ncbi:MAG: hypothetical protein ACXWLR_03970 [Myxococcales bacterium]
MEGEAVIAFKFLRAGGIAPFSEFHWTRGTWVEAPVNGGPGTGIHGCRVAHLPYWVDDELWRVELEGDAVERKTQLEARRGRLISRVDAWDPRAFAGACASRAREYAARAPSAEMDDYAAKAARGMAGNSGFMAAVAAVAAQERESAFADERAWQARWIAESLRLQDGV